MTCVAPGILALVPESQAQTELGIDETGHVRERGEEKRITSLRVGDLAAPACPLVNGTGGSWRSR